MIMRSPALLIGGALLALGCSSDFTPDYRLVKPRVLALQANPPQPQQGSTTTLRALLYLPENETPSYHWSWCPAPTVADNGFACPVEQAAFAASLGLAPAEAPSLDLGTGETAVLTNVFAPDLLAALCSGKADVTLTGGVSVDGGSAGAAAAGTAPGLGQWGLWTCTSAGFPITVRMEFQTPSMSQAVAAVGQVFLPTDATLPGNQNPVVGGLATVLPAPGTDLDDAASIALRRHVKYRLQTAMDPAVSQTFRGWTRDNLGGYIVDGSGKHVIGDVQEIIRLKWYVEGGDLSDVNDSDGGDTGYNPYAAAPQPFSAALELNWKTPKQIDYGKDRARIIVVARDDRGGVGWTSAAVTLEPQP
jgi:hypothetical protein